MSRKTSVAKNKIDKCVRRTRERLGDALVELIKNKPFDAISVQEVLTRAQVSRSTFYTHYRGKNDLLLSDAEDFFEGFATMLSRRNDSSKRIAPVRELCAHLGEWRPFCAALVSADRMHDVMELGQDHFAVGIKQRLDQLPGAHEIPAKQRSVVANALAGALFALLWWWIRHNLPESPARMDDLYHRLAWNGLRCL
jgi:AcrR family transcriptional regulator